MTELCNRSSLACQWGKFSKIWIKRVRLGQLHETGFEALTKNIHDLRGYLTNIGILGQPLAYVQDDRLMGRTYCGVNKLEYNFEPMKSLRNVVHKTNS